MLTYGKKNDSVYLSVGSTTMITTIWCISIPFSIPDSNYQYPTGFVNFVFNFRQQLKWMIPILFRSKWKILARSWRRHILRRRGPTRLLPRVERTNPYVHQEHRRPICGLWEERRLHNRINGSWGCHKMGILSRRGKKGILYSQKKYLEKY